MFYKPRYLRQVKQQTNKIYGFPKGIPEGWSSQNKIHFIAHSQGAATVRYLQYLLSIDYFALPGEAKVDKSNWIASVTCISGCLNGSLGPYLSSMNDKNFVMKSDKNRYLETINADLLNGAFKVFSFFQNTIEPAGTQEIEPENVVKVFKEKPQSKIKSILVDPNRGKNDDILYELGPQYGLLLDLNHEVAGFNKRKDETYIQYIDRLSKNNFAETSQDYAVPEFPPHIYQQKNALHLTSSETYYFAISSGEKKQRFLKCKEY